jgi:RHS repeat-associated protein
VIALLREDDQTGLYYVKARYYNPNLGRFLQTDPSGFGGGFNLYAYAENDPVNLTDSTGLTPDGGGYTVTLSESVATPFMAAAGGPSSMIVSATATYDEVTVSLWPNAAFGRGHVGIGVDTDDTHGYYPRILGFLSWGADVPGVVWDDADHNAGQTPQLLHHRSNASSDALMLAAISLRAANPGYYNLTGNNCTQFVASVLRAGHIDPQSSTQAPMVDPKQYFDGLKQSGEWH